MKYQEYRDDLYTYRTSDLVRLASALTTTKDEDMRDILLSASQLVLQSMKKNAPPLGDLSLFPRDIK